MLRFSFALVLAQSFVLAKPLQLADADFRVQWEGQIAPNVAESVLLATVDGTVLEVRIYYGTLDPSPATFQAAQEELDRLRLPPPP